MAGRDWLEAFLRRNPSVAVRKPEATSMSRIKGFNKSEVSRFFTNTEEVMSSYKFSPLEMYNMDETGMGTVQVPGSILAPNGQKRVGFVTSWGRGNDITAIYAINAAGGFIPTMFIFPRQRMSLILEKDGPPGALYKCSKNGWTNEDLVISWLQHFFDHVKPNPQKPLLRVLDSLYSHITLESYKFL
jgi:hypothetical protein